MSNIYKFPLFWFSTVAHAGQAVYGQAVHPFPTIANHLRERGQFCSRSIKFFGFFKEKSSPFPTRLLSSSSEVRTVNYDEKSIQILKPEEATERFDWLKAEELAREYNHPLEWVKRGFEASRRAGISPKFFVDKYIYQRDLPKDTEFERIFIELLNEVRRDEGRKTKNARK